MNEDFSAKNILLATGLLVACAAGIAGIDRLHDRYLDKKRAANMIALARKAAKEITEGELAHEGRIKVEMRIAGVMLDISLSHLTEFRDQKLRKATIEEARAILDAAIAQRFPN